MAVKPFDPSQTDGTTLATIEVGDLTTSGFSDGTSDEIPNLKQWSYSSDALRVGDEFCVDVPDPRGKYRDKLKPGATVKLFLSNPAVNGGAKVQKVTGRITRRRYTSADGEGTVCRITGADLGWHLTNSCGSVFFNLQNATYKRLLEKVLSGDGASWGFAGVRASNDLNRKLKQGRRGAVLEVTANLETPIAQIQIEPGEVWFDSLRTYAMRLGCLVNVSGDGYLQFFRPNYDQATTYRLEYHREDAVENVRNNVQAASLEEALEGRYSELDLVWEQVFDPEANSNGNPNAGKYQRKATATGFADEPPFLYRKTLADGETIKESQGAQRADWMLRRGYFDAWTATYTVRGHFQTKGRDASFWEADTTVDVVDDVLGLNGKFYVSAVRCRRSQGEGDVTEVTVKQPGLLQAL
jgi:hypothetical protein